MKIEFDQQDVIDAVCVMVAARANNNVVTGSQPELVQEPVVHFDARAGFHATARLYGAFHRLGEQELKNAIALYLSAYYTYAEERLLIQLRYEGQINQFFADIIVER